MSEHEREHEDIERLLSRYRPAGPAPALRDRVLHIRPTRPGAWRHVRWPAAAAACLAAAVLHMNASNTFERLDAARATQAALARQAAVDEMAALLGGGDLARRTAEQWIEQTEALAHAPMPKNLEATWTR